MQSVGGKSCEHREPGANHLKILLKKWDKKLYSKNKTDKILIEKILWFVLFFQVDYILFLYLAKTIQFCA